MSVKQISAFVENKPGQLAKFTDVLTQHGVDMRALSLAETEDFGIVRIIVRESDIEKCVAAARNDGYIAKLNHIFSSPPQDFLLQQNSLVYHSTRHCLLQLRNFFRCWH